MKGWAFPKWLAGAGVALIAVGVAFYQFHGPSPITARAAPPAPPSAIACLGRIEPEDGVRRLAAPFSVQGPSIITELRVREGELVASNQVLAVTSNHRTFQADFDIAEAQVKVAQAKLTRLQTGEKPGDIAALAAELQRAEAEWENARTEFKRNTGLSASGSISQTDLDRSRLAAETSAKEVARAREKLNSIQEIRDVDLTPAIHELAVAVATARRAEAELHRTLIRAPFAGQVIKIYARPGEEVTRDGVLELARTDSMFAHAEVYETDIALVKPGQRAEITGDSLGKKISGRVTQVGLRIGKNDVLKTDPAAYADARVVEVKIRLDESPPAAGLIHAQVNILIFP